MATTAPPKPTTLTFVTGNANKLAEVRVILANTSVQLRNQEVDLIEVQGATLEEISVAKCLQAIGKVDGPVLTEDTALCFRALNGLPGAYIKWFFQKLGLEGLNNLLAAYEDKSAEAVCTFAFIQPGMKEPLIFQGRTPGKIVPARGVAKFGFDPVFQPDGFEQTYAEMDKEQKNSISHRGRALAKLREWLEEDTTATATQ